MSSVLPYVRATVSKARNIVHHATQQMAGARPVACADKLVQNRVSSAVKVDKAFESGLKIAPYDGNSCQQAAYAHNFLNGKMSVTVLIKHQDVDGKVETHDGKIYDYHALSGFKCKDTGKTYVWDPKLKTVFPMPTYISQQLKNSPQLMCTVSEANAEKHMFAPENMKNLLAQLPGNKEFVAQVESDCHAHSSLPGSA